MKFLKTKITKANQIGLASSSKKSGKKAPLSAKITKPKEPGEKKLTKREARKIAKSYKNIAKNFGRAICSFTVSSTSDDYLIPITEKEGVNLSLFREYIEQRKEEINGIEGFRRLLLVDPADPPDIQQYKRCFQKIAEVFMKYFSVNWIFSGRLSYQMLYLKLRFKILRRIQHPELFTFIK